MTASKILAEQIKDITVSSLPTHPTAPDTYGGCGYSASDMKAAFDRLPLFIIARYNELIDAICAEGEDSVTHAIKSGVVEGQSLAELLSQITTGELASYLSVGDSSLAVALAQIKQRISEGEQIITDFGERIDLYDATFIEMVEIFVQKMELLEGYEERIAALEEKISQYDDGGEANGDTGGENTESTTGDGEVTDGE